MGYDDSGKWIEDPALVALHELAKKIATRLPPLDQWSYPTKQNTSDEKHLHWSASIVCGDLGIQIERKRDGKSVSISGSYPTHTKKGEYIGSHIPTPHIGCAISKGAAAIALDIERRLLPTLRSSAAEAAKLIAEYDAHDNGKDATLARVQKAARGSLRKGDDSMYLCDLPEELGGEVRVNSATSVELKLRLTPELAIKIIESLRK